jgi:hypothetical protein
LFCSWRIVGIITEESNARWIPSPRLQIIEDFASFLYHKRRKKTKQQQNLIQRGLKQKQIITLRSQIAGSMCVQERESVLYSLSYCNSWLY